MMFRSTKPLINLMELVEILKWVNVMNGEYVMKERRKGKSKVE